MLQLEKLLIPEVKKNWRNFNRNKFSFTSFVTVSTCNMTLALLVTDYKLYVEFARPQNKGCQIYPVWAFLDLPIALFYLV